MKSLKMLCLFRNKLGDLPDVSNAILFFKDFLSYDRIMVSYERSF